MGAAGEPAFLSGELEEEADAAISNPGTMEPELSRAGAASRLGPLDGSTIDVEPPALVSDAGLLGFLPELKPTGFRCPIATDVEIAADTEGGVHLLCSDVSLESARIAEAWLRGNRNLIANVIEFSGVSTIHVFTTDPPRVADLHRTGLRLHLIIEDGEHRRRVPLNSEQNAVIPE